MKFFLTTAIDYVNSRPHLGTAYEKITADVVARYHRLCGDHTYFLMGNDEHSQNVFRRAQELGLDPRVYCDQMEEVFTSVWRSLDVSFTDFIRTTDTRRHRPAVQAMAQACYDRGDVYEGIYEGWYCVGCEAFKQEKDLIGGCCPIHPSIRPEWIKEKNWFFRLSAYRDALLAHYAANPGFIEPDVRRNEILRLVEAGLEDISVSRAGQSWGIPLPFDPGSVAYVWFDALINYAAAVGYGWDEHRFDTWWPANLHVIGKDITRFHCVIWPAMLMSARVPLPSSVFAHGFISVDGQRMSKSLGNVIDPVEAAQRCGVDALRLYVTKEVPYGGDGDFTWQRLEEKYNADLANNLGNLTSRLTAMSERYRAGTLPAAAGGERLPAIATAAVADFRSALDRLALHDGVAAAFRLINATNLFIADTQPWAMAKDDTQSDGLTVVLSEATEALRIAAVLLLPVMPGSAADILRRVGETRAAGELRLTDAAWGAGGEKHTRNDGPLWPRKDRGAIHVSDPVQSSSAQLPADASSAASAASTPVPSAAPSPSAPAVVVDTAPLAAGEGLTQAAAPGPVDERLSIDDFMKVELRTAKVLTAERVPKSKKLMKLTLDVGAEPRTIVAGIAEAYQAEQLVGRTVVIVANLKPAKLMGIESNGMVLAASPDGGQPLLLNAEPAAPGTRVR